MITETAEHTVEPYYDILLLEKRGLSDCTRVVLVKSTGNETAGCTWDDDETARIWISLGIASGYGENSGNSKWKAVSIHLSLYGVLILILKILR